MKTVDTYQCKLCNDERIKSLNTGELGPLFINKCSKVYGPSRNRMKFQCHKATKVAETPKTHKPQYNSINKNSIFNIRKIKKSS